MRLKNWEELPEKMKNEAVRPYYNMLRKKQSSLVLKRLFDILLSSLLLLIFSPLFLLLALAIKIDSPGPVFFRQRRITQYGKVFYIFKFRTMVTNADKIGGQLTSYGDTRITRVGAVIRKFRLDEISQLIDVFRGTMTFVGTRPEVEKYVNNYTPEMFATLLLPAGVTSEASIYFKDESTLLNTGANNDEVYLNAVMPQKMTFNLKSIENFSLINEIKIMIITLFVVAKN